MKIYKVINNNVLSAYDDKKQEVVVMGRGIGFKAKAGDTIDEGKIEKVFHIENSELSRRFQEMISEMPLEHMQISADIISYAKEECNMKLNQSIYLALMDHINFAIGRYRQGIQLPNALLGENIWWESTRSALWRRGLEFISRRMKRVSLPSILSMQCTTLRHMMLM